MSTALAVSTFPTPDHGTSILADMLGRNEYDALQLVPDSPTAKAAADLISAGVTVGPIDQPGITGGRKDWYAVNVDVYGVAAGGRVIVAQESPMPARPAPLGMKSGREGEWRRPLAVGEVEVVYRLVLIARSGV